MVNTMQKKSSFKSRLGHILFWSVISAAFIGPGTVTTAASAGAGYGLSLGWALIFSALGCFILQEATARLTIASGLSLSQTFMFGRFGVVGAVVFGCMAYEAGNLLGAYSGIALVWDAPQWLIVLLLGGSAAILLWGQRAASLARTLGFLVMVLGLAFLVLAFQSPIPFSENTSQLLHPSFPFGAELLLVSLVGTTIVPYNIFLGSGLSEGRRNIPDMRLGLAVSIGLGGVFSLAIMVVGAHLDGPLTFPALATELETSWGLAGRYLLGLGLLVAGFTSTLTAPMAAGLAVKSALPQRNLSRGKRYYRNTWLLVLLVGMVVGSLEVKIVPAIILAQAFNGFVLPLVVAFLSWAVNQPKLMGEHLTRPLGNAGLTLVLGVSFWLGLHNLISALDKALETKMSTAPNTGWMVLSMAILLSLGTTFYNMENRRKEKRVKM